MVDRWSHWVLPWVTLLGLLRSQPVQACGASPTPRYSVLDSAPSGVDVPINAPLVLHLGEQVAPSDLPPLSTSLYLRQMDSDESVMVPLWSGPFPDGEISFVPETTLLPNIAFEVAFYTGQDDPLSSNTTPAATWQFVTGTEAAPPLSLEGELSVTLEPGEAHALECMVPCSGCTATGPAFPVTNARVKLPRLLNGFPAHRAELWLTDNVPKTFFDPGGDPGSHVVQLGGQLTFDELEAGEVVWPLPAEDAPYKPCFALQAFDARGDLVQAQPVCLEQDVTSTPLAPDSNNGTAARQSSACSYAPASRRADAWLAMFLLLGGLSRRRKSRSAS